MEHVSQLVRVLWVGSCVSSLKARRVSSQPGGIIGSRSTELGRVERLVATFLGHHLGFHHADAHAVAVVCADEP